MSAYTPGTRVVLRIPDPVIGVVRRLTAGGMVVVDVGDESAALSSGDLMPAMPRDRHDVDLWRWWWRNGRPVWVTWTASGVVWSPSSGWPHGEMVSSADDWRGPVAPPPEVRHG